MLTTMVENWPGYRDGIMGPDLMAEMRAQAERFGAEIIQGDVTSVDLSKRPFTLNVEQDPIHRADALIVATGASAKWLDLGVDKKLSGRGVSTCATCDGFFFKGLPVAVIGGGDTAMEEAIYLSKLATQVTVIHRRDTLRASKVMQDKALSIAEHLVHLEHRGHRHQGPRSGQGHVAGAAQHQDRRDAASWPSTACSSASATCRTRRSSRASWRCTTTATSKTHDGSRTSVPGVFAAGDVQDHVYRQAVTAAGSGCMAAIDAERFLSGTLHESSATAS